MVKSKLGTAERAVYELIESGVFTPAHALLYAEEVSNLETAGLVVIRPGGTPEPVHPRPKAKAARVEIEPMVTLVARIPPEMKEALAELGRENLSESVREVITAGLEVVRGKGSPKPPTKRR